MDTNYKGEEMRKYYYIFWVIIIIFLFNTNSYATSLTNFGFETGDFSGWNVDGCIVGSTGLVVNSYTGQHGTYLAVYGTYFAFLASDATKLQSWISQDFTITQGNTISGSAAFDSNDNWMQFNDSAEIMIFDANGIKIAMPWYMDAATVGVTIGNYNQTPWQSWSWTAPSSGTYTVEFIFRDLGNPNSKVLFDAPQITNVVPEPSTWLLLCFGLMGLVGVKKKFS